MTPGEDGWECDSGCHFTPEGKLDKVATMMKGTTNVIKSSYHNQLEVDVLEAFTMMEVKKEHLRDISVERSGRYVVVKSPNPGILIGSGGCTVKGAGEHIGCRIKVLKS